MKVEEWNIENVKPYDKNPRNNDGAVEATAQSIKQFGWQQPIVVDKSGVIIAGHTRLKAAHRLHMKQVPVTVADNLSDEQVKAYRLADNKVGELADWDDGLLDGELNSIMDIDMEDFGFDFGESLDDEDDDQKTNNVKEDDYKTIDIPERAKVGDMFQLGKHRLLCGDSTKPEDVKKLMGERLADLVFTDPPYGMKKERLGVLNDNLNADQLMEFNRKWVPNTLNALSAKGSWYCWGTDQSLLDMYAGIIRPLVQNGELNFLNLITWDKNNVPGEKSDLINMYPVASEKCLFLTKGIRSVGNNSIDYFNGWEPIRSYLADEADKAGMSKKDINEITGSQMASHWVTKSQWLFIKKDTYELLQNSAKAKLAHAFAKKYKELQNEYEAIRDGDGSNSYKAYRDEVLKNRAYFDNEHDVMNDTWHFDRTSQEERKLTGGHATPKPVALCARGIVSSTPVGGTVLDVFGGSGSTLIAAEQTGRCCNMMELDPHYVDVIINRWEQLTGEKAKKID